MSARETRASCCRHLDNHMMPVSISAQTLATTPRCSLAAPGMPAISEFTSCFAHLANIQHLTAYCLSLVSPCRCICRGTVTPDTKRAHRGSQVAPGVPCEQHLITCRNYHPFQKQYAMDQHSGGDVLVGPPSGTVCTLEQSTYYISLISLSATGLVGTCPLDLVCWSCADSRCTTPP